MRAILTSDTHFGFSHDDEKNHETFLKKISSEKPDVVVHAGDWSSHHQDQFKKTLEMFRDNLSCPIICIRGNHDFWQTPKPQKSIQELFELHEKWFQECEIHHLSKGCFEIAGWSFYGFDGWYSHHVPPTNDGDHLPLITEGLPTMHWFTRKAYRDLVETIDSVKNREKSVCVTHFPCFTDDQRYANFCANLNYLEVLSDNFELLLFGHSHKFCDFRFRETRIVNCGSDYLKPTYKVLDL